MTLNRETLRSDALPTERDAGPLLYLTWCPSDGWYRVEGRRQTFQRFREYLPASAYFDDLLLRELAQEGTP